METITDIIAVIWDFLISVVRLVPELLLDTIALVVDNWPAVALWVGVSMIIASGVMVFQNLRRQ